jgi:DNA polymerase-4
MRLGHARSILHIDMDAFYASVEEQDRPELKGKPLIVGGTGGTGGRGVVAAANYVVRRFGVRSAMPMSEALRRCPDAVCVQPRMTRYKEVSEQVFAIFHEFTPLVEGLSLDEAFLDVTASQQLLGNAESIGSEIRRRIVKQTGLTASVGIAPNKLLAKIASDLNKPDGMCRIGADNMREILDGLPIEKLFGIGPRTLPAVHAAGIRSFGDLRAAGDEVLWRAFGKHVHPVWMIGRSNRIAKRNRSARRRLTPGISVDWRSSRCSCCTSRIEPPRGCEPMSSPPAK